MARSTRKAHGAAGSTRKGRVAGEKATPAASRKGPRMTVRRSRRSLPKRKPIRRLVTVEDLMDAIQQDPKDLELRLVLAELRLRSTAREKAEETFEGYEEPAEFPDVETASRYLRARALGCYYQGMLAEAGEYAARVVQIDPGSLDAQYVTAAVQSSLREWEAAEEVATRYIEAFREAFKTDASGRESTGSYRHLSHVLGMLGVAASEQGKLEEAAVEFERAIKADPTNEEPYLGLANVYRQLGRMVEARGVVERGMKDCSQVQELRLLAKTLVERPTVSACLIVKNEEELLPGCLESIRDWVDEIIVVDTGSEDRTVEIAREYGARVFEQEWEGDFAKHRNYSLAQATGDWVLVIDADERFTEGDVPVIQQCLLNSKVRAVAVNIFNVGRKYEDLVTFLPSVRLFRRELGLRYEGIVHNQLNLDPSEPVARVAATIRHLGYALAPEKLKAKATRTLALLDRQLAEDPDNAFALFNTAQVLLGLGKPSDQATAEQIVAAASRAMALTDPEKPGERHIHLMATYQLALIKFWGGEYERAEEYGLRVLELKDDYLDPILLLGHVGLQRGQVDRAEHYYRRYLEMQGNYDESAERDEIIVVHLRSRHVAWYGLGLVAECRQDYERARGCYERVVEGTGEFLDVHSRLGYLYLEAGRLAEAEQMFGRQLDLAPEVTAALVGQALVLGEQGRERGADMLLVRALEMCCPGDPELLGYARVLWRYDRPEQAGRFVDAAVAGAESSAALRREAADLYFKLGRYERAGELYLALADEDSGDADLCNDLAGCYFKAGDLVQAEEWYGRALEKSPMSPTVLRNLGLTRIRRGRIEEAITVLEEYLGLVPEDRDVGHLVGDLYARLGQYGRAIPLYERCLQATPGDRLALFSLAECYLGLGHRESALVGYRRVLDLDRDFEPAQRRVQELAGSC